MQRMDFSKEVPPWLLNQAAPTKAAEPRIQEHLPAYAGLKAFFSKLESQMGLLALEDGERFQRMGVYLFDGLAAHLYTGELPTGVIHAQFSNPRFVPDPAVEVMVPSPEGVLTMKLASAPRTKNLRWSRYGEGFEYKFPFEIESFSVYVTQPVYLAVSMCTYFTPEDEACIASLIRAGLITGSAFDLAWTQSCENELPSNRDMEIRARVLEMLGEAYPPA